MMTLKKTRLNFVDRKKKKNVTFYPKMQNFLNNKKIKVK